MDCDLEAPPEAIPELYARAREGYEVVHGVRRSRRHGELRRAASRLYRFLMLESERHAEYATLSLISRKVVDAVLRIGDRDREYLLMLDWLGFSHTSVEFDHGERHEGESAYTLRRLLRVAVDGMFFRTTVLLRVIVLVGFLIATCGALLAAYNIVEYIFGHSPKGYTSLVVLLLLLSGFIIICLGVVGLYVGRIFDQVKQRPLFVVDNELNAREQERETQAPLP
jgi:dolichol-phosphate mannosyltransferase